MLIDGAEVRWCCGLVDPFDGGLGEDVTVLTSLKRSRTFPAKVLIDLGD